MLALSRLERASSSGKFAD
jgi:hypothetical protein